MQTDTLAGIVVLGFGLVISLSIYLWIKYKRGDADAALQTAGMAAGCILTAGALLPQAVRNSADPDALEAAFSPFLLSTLLALFSGPHSHIHTPTRSRGPPFAGLFPVAVLLKLPGEYRILHEAGPNERLIVQLQLLGLLVILVLYDVFMVQFAAATSDRAIEGVFIFLSVVYIMLTLIAFIVLFDSKWRQHLLKLTGFSLP